MTFNVTSLCLIFRSESGEEPNSTPSSLSNMRAHLIDIESCIMSLTGRFWVSIKVIPTVLCRVYLYTLFLCFQVQTIITRLTMLMTKLGASILLFWLTTGTLSTRTCCHSSIQLPRQRERTTSVLKIMSKFRKGQKRWLLQEQGHAFKNLQQHVNARVNLVISIDSVVNLNKKKRKSDLVFSSAYWTQASGERMKRLQRVFFFPERSFRPIAN